MSAMLVMPVMAILFAPAIWFLLGRPRFLPSLPPAEKPGKASAAISIIIPARNEETNIARLLESIQQQSSQPLETIVVNDGSTDNTASIASQLGARVIDVEALPDGWMGKPWACQQGAHAAILRMLQILRILPREIGCSSLMPTSSLSHPPCMH